MIQLLRDHPDVFFILDIKYSNLAVWKTYVQQAGGDRSLIERLLPHVADQAQLNDFRTVYPLQNDVLALYETQWANRMDDPEAVAFVRANRTPAVAMWSGTRDPSLTLAQNQQQARRFTPAFAQALQAAGANAYVHSLNDDATVQSFWDQASAWTPTSRSRR